MDGCAERVEVVVVHELVQQRLEQRLDRDRALVRRRAHEDLDRAVAAALSVQLEDDAAAAAAVRSRLVAQPHVLAREHELLAQAVDEPLRAARQPVGRLAVAEAGVPLGERVDPRRRDCERPSREHRVEPRTIEPGERAFREHRGRGW